MSDIESGGCVLSYCLRYFLMSDIEEKWIGRVNFEEDGRKR